MNKKYLTLSIIFLVCYLVACSKSSETKKLSKTLGVDLTGGTVMANIDTHGGFHGDGDTLIKISFDDVAGTTITHDIAENSDWNELPLTKNLHTAVYGTGNSKGGQLVTNSEGEIIIPTIQNGYYYFFDKHSESKNAKEDTYLFSRYSYNFTIAIYDIDENILYFYELDT